MPDSVDVVKGIGASLRAQLELNPSDFLSYLVAADRCEELGDDDGAYTLRWMADNEKYPYKHDPTRPSRPYALPKVPPYPWCWDPNHCPQTERAHVILPEKVVHASTVFLTDEHYEDWNDAVLALREALMVLRKSGILE